MPIVSQWQASLSFMKKQKYNFCSQKRITLYKFGVVVRLLSIKLLIVRQKSLFAGQILTKEKFALRLNETSSPSWDFLSSHGSVSSKMYFMTAEGEHLCLIFPNVWRDIYGKGHQNWEFFGMLGRTVTETLSSIM